METNNKSIKQKRNETKERRKNMHCRVFELKVTKNKLNRLTKEHLKMLFLEGKWFKNAVIASDDIFQYSYNVDSVQVKVGQVFENRSIVHLSSQMKQDFVANIKQDIINLAKSKSSGHKVGRLQFKSYCYSIPLRQYGSTFRIDYDNNTVTIQGLPRPMKVKGMKQLQSYMEIANAKLIQKPSGYYLHITTFSEPVESDAVTAIGVDMGIATNLTTSDGDKYNISVPESKAVLFRSRIKSRSYVKNGRNNTKNHYKRIHRLRTAYEKQNNIKQDLANKTVHDLLRDNEYIAIQDELIAGWHKGLFGKQVQHSCMGIIKAKLKNSSKTHVIKSSYPSTQLCPECKKKTFHPLSKRSYDCNHCNYHHPDRDIKAADTILIASFDPDNIVVQRK